MPGCHPAIMGKDQQRIMDYSAANHGLWNIIEQLGMIAGVILLANFLRQKVSFIRKSLMPVAVLGGFLLLIVKYTGLTHFDSDMMERPHCFKIRCDCGQHLYGSGRYGASRHASAELYADAGAF